MNAQALQEAKRATKYLASWDEGEPPLWFPGRCSDAAEILAAYLRWLGFRAKAVYGRARLGKGRPFLHTWVTVDGEIFDQTVYGLGLSASKFLHSEDASVKEHFWGKSRPMGLVLNRNLLEDLQDLPR